MENIEMYLASLVGSTPAIASYDASGDVNLFISKSYRFYLVESLGIRFLLIHPLEKFTVSQMEKHVKMIEAATQYSTAVYLKDSSYYIVTKFLEKGIAFLDKNRQMFLPFLGLRLQNNTNTAHEKIHEKFTPLMQLVFLWILYQNKEYYEQSEIAAALDISGMTVLRTLNFFVQNSLMSYTTEGKTERKKVFHLISKKEYYQRGKEFLISPVMESIYVSELPARYTAYQSGLSALSELTMLGEPDHAIFAAERSEREQFLSNAVSKERALEEGLYEIQIMRYDFSKIICNSHIDPVTLIKSLNVRDERIEMAVSTLMEEYEWYEE